MLLTRTYSLELHKEIDEVIYLHIELYDKILNLFLQYLMMISIILLFCIIWKTYKWQ